MKNVLYLVPVLLILTACAAEDPEPLTDYPNSHLLVEASELYNTLEETDIFLIDARSEIDGAVIPGAVHFPAISRLTDENHPVEHFLVDADTFQRLMQEIGLNEDDTVVIYDDGNALAAARLFYALDYYGFSNASILNGGFEAWTENELPTADEPSLRNPGNFTHNIQEALSCDFNYIIAASQSDDKIIFDARSFDEFTGADERAPMSGHIPNAVHIEWSTVLEQEGVPYFQPAESIRELFAARGITPDKEIIPHCHTNVRGSHAYFTLRLMGYDSVRPYEGSWAEYGNRPDAIVQ